MLRTKPGTFVAGEMLDWETPTGGYLLQACFATGFAAGQGAARYLTHEAGRIYVLTDLAAYAFLFAVSFVAATILPAQSELVLVGFLMLGKFYRGRSSLLQASEIFSVPA